MEENLSGFARTVWGKGEVYEGFWWGNLRDENTWKA